MAHSTLLSVNINKVATLRNARGGKVPNLLQVALDAERFGAQGITVHPRPDERHIRYSDVRELKPELTTEFNVEGYPGPDFMELVFEVNPAQVTLVPDPPEALTSNAGWDTREKGDFLKGIITHLKARGIRTSIFLEPDPTLIESAVATGTDRIELYTEDYAVGFAAGQKEEAIAPYIATAEAANAAGLGINAGHDLDLKNLNYFATNIPGLLEVSIGHALISDALYYGLENTIQMYRLQLSEL
ncbi:pyridoxine 5'-phosphate synthase [Cryomorphaceae bacterium]|nr:pyridoxine 5'-phosphate synthase [Cryomorphaceae bacterium]